MSFEGYLRKLERIRTNRQTNKQANQMRKHFVFLGNYNVKSEIPECTNQ